MIGQRIKLRRKMLNLTQNELAERIGYRSGSSINKIELGLADIPQSKIKLFADALNTEPSYLIGLNTEEPIYDYKTLLQSYRQSKKLLNTESLAEMFHVSSEDLQAVLAEADDSVLLFERNKKEIERYLQNIQDTKEPLTFEVTYENLDDMVRLLKSSNVKSIKIVLD